MLFAVIIPSVVLAVDGSLRTFTCVAVIPSIGAAVGAGVDSAGVWVGLGGAVGGSVDVMTNKVGVPAEGAERPAAHPESSRVKRVKKTILCTSELYIIDLVVLLFCFGLPMVLLGTKNAAECGTVLCAPARARTAAFGSGGRRSVH